MKPIDMLRLAFMSLWRRKTRTALTILGVVIGTACIVVMVALGLGSMQQFNEAVAGNIDLTQITVMSASQTEGGAGKKLDDNAVARMRQLPGVKSVTPVLEIPAYIKVGRYASQYAMITALDPAASPGFRFAEGKMFSGGGIPEIVLGSNTLFNFVDESELSAGGKPGKGRKGGGEPEIPDVDWLHAQAEIWFGGKQYAETSGGGPASRSYRGGFSGVLQESQSEESYGMYMSLDVARKMIKENLPVATALGLSLNGYTTVRVYARDMGGVAGLLDGVKDMGFNAYSPTEDIESMQAEQKRQQGQLMMMAVVSLLVSAIGIANTMLAGIMERRGEIGVMKVIGLSISRIRRVFLMESAAIGVLGGLVGLLLGCVISFFVNGSGGQAAVLGMQFQSGVKLIIPWWLASGAVCLAAAVGIASGVYPAVKATRMSALEAIRSN